jgi:hypothetical protein
MAVAGCADCDAVTASFSLKSADIYRLWLKNLSHAKNAQNAQNAKKSELRR